MVHPLIRDDVNSKIATGTAPPLRGARCGNSVPHYLSNILLPLFTLVLLSGCILVEDFSPMWEKGVADPCISKMAESLYYNEFRRDPSGKNMDELAHSFTLGKEHFLMLKQEPTDKGGRMYRFGIVHGIFQRYRLDPAMRRAFEISYPDAPVSLEHDTVKLTSLGEPQLKLLQEIAANPDYWEIEDQNLYNTGLNKACTFDDRDLDKLNEEYYGKKKKK